MMITLTSHENKIDELFHRLKAQEQQTKAINELSLGVGGYDERYALGAEKSG